MTRKEFLLALISAFAIPKVLKPIGKSSFLEIAIIKYKGKFNSRNSGIKRFLWEVSKRTSIEVSFKIKEISLENKKELFLHPLVFITGDEKVNFNKEELKNLKKFLDFGGLLFADSFSEKENCPFFMSIEDTLKKIYPNKIISIIPKDHVLYRTFNLLDNPHGRLSISKNLYTISNNSINKNKNNTPLKVILSKNDILGAVNINKLGLWEYPVEDELTREMVFRMMINIIMYATCLDYKLDQVHIDYLLKTRR